MLHTNIGPLLTGPDELVLEPDDVEGCEERDQEVGDLRGDAQVLSDQALEKD